MLLTVWKELSKNSYGILDVGANTGIFGLIAKKINPRAQITLFDH